MSFPDRWAECEHALTISTKWNARVASLKTLKALIQGETLPLDIESDATMIKDALESVKPCMALQLQDRRSTIVKEACSAVIVLCKTALQLLAMQPGKTDTAHMLNDMLVFYINHLMSLSSITIKVINTTAHASVLEILKLFSSTELETDVHDYCILRRLVELSQDSHPNVRERAYMCIHQLLSASSSEDLATLGSNVTLYTVATSTHITKPKSSPKNKASVALMLKKLGHDDTADMMLELAAEDGDEKTTELDTKHDASMSLSMSVSAALGHGVQDTNSTVRQHARSCLVLFSQIDLKETKKIMGVMPSSAQKMFREEVTNYALSMEMDSPLPPIAATLVATPPKSPPSAQHVTTGRGRRRKKLLSRTTLHEKKDDEGIEMYINEKRKTPSPPKHPKKQFDTNESMGLGKHDDLDSSGNIEMSDDDVIDEKTMALRKIWDTLTRILDLATVTADVLQYCHEDNVCAVLMGFVSRLPFTVNTLIEDPKLAMLTENKIIEDKDEKVNMRRSYYAMQLFSGGESSTIVCRKASLSLIAQNSRVVILHLLACFHPRSRSNKYHVCKLLLRIAEKFPGTLTAALNSEEGAALFPMMWDAIHIAPVGDTLLDVFGWQYRKSSEICIVLQKNKFMKYLVEVFTSPCVKLEENTHERIAGIGTFLQQLIRRVCTTSVHLAPIFDAFLETTMIITKKTLTPRDANVLDEPDSSVNPDVKGGQRSQSVLISRLIGVITSADEAAHPEWQRMECLAVLNEMMTMSYDDVISIVTSHRPTSFLFLGRQTGDANKEMANPLLALRKELARSLMHSIPSICAVGILPPVHMDKKDAHETGRRSARCKVAYCDVLMSIIQCCDIEQQPISRVLMIPTSAFSQLITWFFEHSDNNFLTRVIYRLLSALVKATAREDEKEGVLLSHCLQNDKLLSRMANIFPKVHNQCLATFIPMLVQDIVDVIPDGKSKADTFLTAHLDGNAAWETLLSIM